MDFLLVFILGTIVGSGVTAVLWRLESGEAWTRGRSKCPKCKKVLGPLELVPVFSWLMQRGRCRGCKGKIAWSYPAIELATALLFVFGYAARIWWWGIEPVGAQIAILTLIRDFYAIAVLTIVFVFDMTNGLILDRVTLPALAILAVFSLILGMNPLTLAVGIAVGAGFFWLQYVISKGRWIGGGDIRLGAVLGALLGWKLLLVAFFLAYVSGATVGLSLIASGRKEWGSRIPFGTFLSAGALVVLYFGEEILRMYVGA